MGVPYWADAPALYDTITIGSVTIADTHITIDGAPSIKIDTKTGPGSDGASETYQGYEPAKIVVVFWLFTAKHFEDFQQLLREVLVKPGKTGPNPVDILHPRLELFNLRKFYITATPLLRTVKPGIEEVKLQCLEWFPAAKPSMKSGGPGGGAKYKSANIFDNNKPAATSKMPSKTNVKP